METSVSAHYNIVDGRSSGVVAMQGSSRYCVV